MDDKFGFMTPRPSTTVPSTPQALNMRLSDPESSSTASILTPMTNRPLASGSGPRLPFTGSFKGAPLTPSSGGGGSSSSISSSKSRGLREEAKTSSARYHQRASGIPKQKPPIKKSPSSAPPAPPPNTLSFAQKLRVWVFKYYGKSAERDNLVSDSRYHRDVLVNSEITQLPRSIGKRTRTENLEHGTLGHIARMPGRA
ncbi:hypothetical protein BJ912DRAFT_240600 [Pholiota molesta]|nr:hypothetical protein BJ912DRAFT_240600 [Pholiota molesta]